MPSELITAFPQYALLILAGLAYAWIYKQHRTERVEWMAALKEQQETWRVFLAEQNQIWLSNINGIVGRFREALAEDREETLGELRRLGDSLAAHDKHAQDVAQRVAEVLAVKLVEAAKGETPAGRA